jgi:hypothetical protein
MPTTLGNPLGADSGAKVETAKVRVGPKAD